MLLIKNNVFQTTYGYTKNSNSNDHAVLRRADVEIKNINNKRYMFNIYGNFFFGNRGVCHGDSGGPAYYKQGKEYILVGLASNTTLDPETKDCLVVKSGFTNLSFYKDWIRSNL